MKTILMSIHPEYCEKIFVTKEKLNELRKTCPPPPFKVVVYCTKGSRHLAIVSGGGTARLFNCCDWKSAIPVGGEIGNGKVIGEFICDKVDVLPNNKPYGEIITEDILRKTCLTFPEFVNYGGLKLLHITAPKLYDKPKELSEVGVFCKDFIDCENIFCEKDTCRGGFIPVTRAPQSWQYIQAPTEEL